MLRYQREYSKDPDYNIVVYDKTKSVVLNFTLSLSADNQVLKNVHSSLIIDNNIFETRFLFVDHNIFDNTLPG